MVGRCRDATLLFWWVDYNNSRWLLTAYVWCSPFSLVPLPHPLQLMLQQMLKERGIQLPMDRNGELHSLPLSAAPFPLFQDLQGKSSLQHSTFPLPLPSPYNPPTNHGRCPPALAPLCTLPCAGVPLTVSWLLNASPKKLARVLSPELSSIIQNVVTDFNLERELQSFKSIGPGARGRASSPGNQSPSGQQHHNHPYYGQEAHRTLAAQPSAGVRFQNEAGGGLGSLPEEGREGGGHAAPGRDAQHLRSEKARSRWDQVAAAAAAAVAAVDGAHAEGAAQGEGGQGQGQGKESAAPAPASGIGSASGLNIHLPSLSQLRAWVDMLQLNPTTAVKSSRKPSREAGRSRSKSQSRQGARSPGAHASSTKPSSSTSQPQRQRSRGSSRSPSPQPYAAAGGAGGGSSRGQGSGASPHKPGHGHGARDGEAGAGAAEALLASFNLELPGPPPGSFLPVGAPLSAEDVASLIPSFRTPGPPGSHSKQQGGGGAGAHGRDSSPTARMSLREAAAIRDRATAWPSQVAASGMSQAEPPFGSTLYSGALPYAATLEQVGVWPSPPPEGAHPSARGGHADGPAGQQQNQQGLTTWMQPEALKAGSLATARSSRGAAAEGDAAGAEEGAGQGAAAVESGAPPLAISVLGVMAAQAKGKIEWVAPLPGPGLHSQRYQYQVAGQGVPAPQQQQPQMQQHSMHRNHLATTPETTLPSPCLTHGQPNFQLSVSSSRDADRPFPNGYSHEALPLLGSPHGRHQSPHAVQPHPPHMGQKPATAPSLAGPRSASRGGSLGAAETALESSILRAPRISMPGPAGGPFALKPTPLRTPGPAMPVELQRKLNQWEQQQQALREQAELQQQQQMQQRMLASAPASEGAMSTESSEAYHNHHHGHHRSGGSKQRRGLRHRVPDPNSPPAPAELRNLSLDFLRGDRVARDVHKGGLPAEARVGGAPDMHRMGRPRNVVHLLGGYEAVQAAAAMMQQVRMSAPALLAGSHTKLPMTPLMASPRMAGLFVKEGEDPLDAWERMQQ